MDLEQKAIERIKVASEMSLNHYGKPLMCTYSGGKDSDVMLELFKRAGVFFEVVNSHTTADAPQTVYHIRETFKHLEEMGIPCAVEYPTFKGKRTSMWSLIPEKLMPPTRLMRYCCRVLKENCGNGRYIATGVRWDESTKRKSRKEFESMSSRIKNREYFTTQMLLENNDSKRRMTELCMQKNKMVVNPIIDWTNFDIWDFIKSEKIQTCELYQCGYKRVGCVGCPLAGKKIRWKEFADFPTYKKLYIHAFDRLIEKRKELGKDTKWKNGEEVFLWWMGEEKIEGQMELFEDGFMEKE